MLKRNIQAELLETAKEYPVITVLGPRQSGKTTLAKQVFKDHIYCNLEHPEIRLLAQDDPVAFFDRYKGDVIIDEIQRVPSLLSYIQVFVDENKRNGQFVLTGSHQLKLHESITQSLAGRTAILKLLPLSIEELQQANINQSHSELMISGFMPKVHHEKIKPSRYYRNYYETYVQRDVRTLIQIKDLSQFEKFIQLLAGRVGQVLNLSSLSNDVGVSSHTLKSWLSVLEASFIVMKLQPYHDNFGKRAIKSPKIYFVDTGLLCFILGIYEENQLLRDPLIGQIYENMVVMDFEKNIENRGGLEKMYFFRTDKGQEVDLLIQAGRKLIPIEIKSAMTYIAKFAKGIKYFQKTTELATKGYVIYAGNLEHQTENHSVLNHKNLNKIIEYK